MITGTHESYGYERRKDNLQHCGYCGSISVSDLLDLLSAGAEIELADQKYGKPHKFYITKDKLLLKFYTVHLHEILSESSIFDALHEQFIKKTGFYFEFDNDNLVWYIHGE